MSDIPLEILTYSSLTTLCQCEQRYKYRYEDKLRLAKEEDGEALVIGSAFHVGCDAYLTGGLEAGLQAVADWRHEQHALGEDANRKLDEQGAKARAMLRASAVKWPRDEATKMSEQLVGMPVVNDETGRASRTFHFQGIVDGITNRRIIDWKGVSNPNDFITSKVIGYQIECYVNALEAQGVEIDCAEFRLVTRPSIKYCGKDADAGAYEERCYNWLLDDPTKLVTHEIFIAPTRLEGARRWLWSGTKRILENRKTGIWLRNELACKNWNRDCEYLPLCLGVANGQDVAEIMERDYQVDEPHPELARAT